jgi:signal peptidase I
MFVYYSFNHDITRNFDWVTGVRWGRIGELVR